MYSLLAIAPTSSDGTGATDDPIEMGFKTRFLIISIHLRIHAKKAGPHGIETGLQRLRALCNAGKQSK